jgi:hypothetical protein
VTLKEPRSKGRRPAGKQNVPSLAEFKARNCICFLKSMMALVTTTTATVPSRATPSAQPGAGSSSSWKAMPMGRLMRPQMESKIIVTSSKAAIMK